MRELNRRYPGARYREVALNPTNPDNLASGIYAEIVQQLRREQVDSVQRETSESGQPMLYIAKPLRVNDASCLACHGTPEAAPPAMRAIYGDAHGFGWQLNETVGAQVVALPMTLPLQRAQQALGNFLAGAFAVVLTVVLALNAMLRRTLLNPIASHQGELHRQAREDELTGAINRRGFFEEAQPALERARASGEAVSVAMFDVDHFKRINDEHGHAAGDQVLRELVQRLRHRVRASDLLGRLGGDEFALLLPHTSLEAARELAGALHARLQAGRYPHAAAVGISMGLAQWDGQETVESLLARADTALYDAKRSGRGRVCG
jgi:diguanylate cyclase (GGDEF)-like protein